MTMTKRDSREARLIKYHPVRFLLLRDDPVWVSAVQRRRQLIQEHEGYSLLSVCEMMAVELEQGGDLLLPSERTAFPYSRIEQALMEGAGGVGGAQEVAFIRWHHFGEQIFDLSAIAAIFTDSDASSVPLERLQLPYESFYIHWGRHLELPCPIKGQYIDGCYVSRESIDGDTELNIAFTSTLPDCYLWDEHSVLANIVVDAESFIDCLGVLSEDKTFDGLGRAILEKGNYPEQLAERWAAYLPAALSIAANCICYLSWEKTEIRESFPPEAPPRLVRQAQGGNERERRRAASKLQSLGFRRIHMAGEALAKQIGLTEGSREVPPHWRRGHWRHQRHGTGRSMIKLIWINGTVVNADKGAPAGGHIYVP